MRLFPPVPFSSKFAREVIEEQGQTIPAGTSLMWMKSIVGRNADLFEEPAPFLSRTRLVSIPDVDVRLLTATSVSPSPIPVRLEPLS